MKLKASEKGMARGLEKLKEKAKEMERLKEMGWDSLKATVMETE